GPRPRAGRRRFHAAPTDSALRRPRRTRPRPADGQGDGQPLGVDPAQRRQDRLGGGQLRPALSLQRATVVTPRLAVLYAGVFAAMVSFDRIVVIFNPQSTGEAPQLAEELSNTLAERLPDVPVQMCPTEHAGHARELAAQAAAA